MKTCIDLVKRLFSSPLVIWLSPLVWMALIFVVSGTPREEIPQYGRWDVWIKKGGHVAAYAMLTLLWLRALQSRLPAGTAVGLALGIALLYAISDEYHQTFVPGRNGTAVDVTVDMVGALLAALIRWRVSRVPKKTGGPGRPHLAKTQGKSIPR